MNRANQTDSYEEVELQERVVLMSRVAKVVKGGRRFSFNALTVVGDMTSQVGLGFGKAKEVPEAIRKSIEDAKKSMIKVKKQNTTIPHVVIGKFKSARVFLKPGAPGTGIIAGEAIRAVVELGGIQDILTKRYGSSNKLNIVKATIDALNQLSTPNEAKRRRGITLPELFGPYSKERKEEKRKEAMDLSGKGSVSEAISEEVKAKADPQSKTEEVAVKKEEITVKEESTAKEDTQANVEESTTKEDAQASVEESTAKENTQAEAKEAAAESSETEKESTEETSEEPKESS